MADTERNPAKDPEDWITGDEPRPVANAGPRLVAVYESEATARRAAAAAMQAGAAREDVRVADDLDAVVSLQGEMREEMEHTLVGPGNVGPFTKEMTKGMFIGIVAGGLIGLVVALPFAAIGFAGWPLWLRLVVVAVCGVVAGSTVGWIVGGAFAARRPEESLAAERGVTVAAPATQSIERALVAAAPIRVDVVDANGQPVATPATEARETPGTPYDIGRHMTQEPHDS